jgi:hypothetical protein
MEEVDPRIAAHRLTKSPERRRSGSRPIRAVSRGDSDRSQHSEEIRRVRVLAPESPRVFKMRETA